jgi:hypothetical protein
MKGHMKDINDEEIKDSLGCLKQGELIDMIVDLCTISNRSLKCVKKQLLKYEEKERHNTKQGKADA